MRRNNPPKEANCDHNNDDIPPDTHEQSAPIEFDAENGSEAVNEERPVEFDRLVV